MSSFISHSLIVSTKNLIINTKCDEIVTTTLQACYKSETPLDKKLFLSIIAISRQLLGFNDDWRVLYINNYESFVFYGSWRTTLEGFREKFGLGYAQEGLWNLMTSATSGEVETDDPLILGWISGSCEPNIKAAQERYSAAVENGKAGGRPKKNDSGEIRKLYQSGMTYEEIASKLGCSTKTVQRAIKELDKTGQKLEKEKEKENKEDIELPASQDFLPSVGKSVVEDWLDVFDQETAFADDEI